MKNLTYQQKVLLATNELAKENPRESGYDFSYVGKNSQSLVIYPWIFIERKKKISGWIKVTDEGLSGSEDDVVGELEKKLKEMKL